MSIKKAAAAGFSTIELLLIIALVFLFSAIIVFEGKNVREKNRDTNRKNTITSLQDQTEAYQAETGNYPTVAQINNANFRKTNFKDFDSKLLRDPLWKSSNTTCTASGQPVLQDSSTPAKGCLGYKPAPAGCDNKNVDCTSYTLTANLESGGHYQKQSIY